MIIIPTQWCDDSPRVVQRKYNCCLLDFCILCSCLEREPAGWTVHAWSLDGLTALPVEPPFISQECLQYLQNREIAPRFQGRGQAREDPSPRPSPLGVGHSQVLDSSQVLEFSELSLTHLPSISLGKKEPSAAACKHLSALSHPCCLGDFICSLISVPNWCPSLECLLHEARRSWSSLLRLPSLT